MRTFLNQQGLIGLISILLAVAILSGISVYMLSARTTSNGQNVYKQAVDNAKDLQIKEEIRMLKQSIEAYRLQKGSLPDSLDDLKTAGLITKVPSNPYDGKVYGYEVNKNSYTLSTKLGDGSNYQIK